MYFPLILIVLIGQSLAETEPLASSGQPMESQPMATNEQTPRTEEMATSGQRTNNQQPQQTIVLVKPSDHLHSKCGPNEVISDCVTPCQPTCEFPNQLPCPEFSARSSFPQQQQQSIIIVKPLPSKPHHPPPSPCFPGCVCAPGFVRNEFGVCIPKSHCPHVCKLHSHFEKCGPRCQPTCEFAEPRGLSVCGQDKHICVSGCFCDAGYVKDLKTGHCVKPKDCSQVCPDNEHYSDYGDACAPTCEHPIVDHYKCKSHTVEQPGCYCNKGFLRDWKTKKCIREYDCPPKGCPANEEWYKCKPCTPTCTDTHPKCPHVCQTGCDCKRGLVEDPKSGKCVPLCECPHFHHPLVN